MSYCEADKMVRKQNPAVLAAFGLAALVLFIYLASQVLGGEVLWFDGPVRGAVHAWASPRLTYAMRGITWLGSEAVLLPLAAILVWRLVAAGRKRAAVLLVVASAGGEILDQILKAIFRRPRPEAFFGYPDPIGFSFPSGHSVASCCFYGVTAAILASRIPSRAGKAAVWAAASSVVLAVGTSRVYLGVHYPSDVLAGYAAAVVWVAAVRAGYGFRMRRNPAVKAGSTT